MWGDLTAILYLFRASLNFKDNFPVFGVSLPLYVSFSQVFRQCKEDMQTL